MGIEIRKITADDTLAIRHQVLWPGKSADFVRVAEDEDAHHFGSFADEELVSVISLFPDQDSMRFRKFATIHTFQNKGLGSKLLEYVISYSRHQQYKMLWCDARSSALAFYERFGFEKFSEPFFKEHIGYYKIRKEL
jgi:GNAT superfamily N-acetyltransferase